MGFRAWFAGLLAARPAPARPAPGSEHLRARAELLESIRKDQAVAESLLAWWESRIDRLGAEATQWAEWERRAADWEVRERIGAVLASVRGAEKRAREGAARASDAVERIGDRVVAIQADLQADIAEAAAYGYAVPALRLVPDPEELRAHGEAERERAVPEEPESDERVFLAELMRARVGGRLDVN